MGNPRPQTRVTLVDHMSGKSYTVILPTNQPVRKMLPELVNSLHLPLQGPGGEEMQYHLTFRNNGESRQINEEETLDSAGISEDATLSITPQMTAGGTQTPGMRFFSLKLTKLDGAELFTTDFMVDWLEFPVRQFVSTLVQSGLLRPGERYDARIIPRVTNDADFNTAHMLQADSIPQGGNGFLDILFEDATLPVEAITYLTTQIRSADSGTAYRYDFSLYRMLNDLLTKIVQMLMDNDELQDGEHFYISISAHQHGRPRIDPVAMVERTPVAVVQAMTEERPPAELAGPSDIIEIQVPGRSSEPQVEEEEEDEIHIIIESQEDLIKPISKSMSDYTDAEICGQINEGQLPIYVRRGCMENVRKACNVSAQVNEEVGGFLVGNVYRDPDSDQLYVEISEAVEADKARGTYVRLEFNYDAWRQVLDRVDSDFPDKFPLGWYHTHLISQTLVLPAEESNSEFIARYYTFFSQLDVFIHRNFFPNPWHVALVMDLRCNKEVFFAWQEGRIAPNHGFYLYGE